MRNSFFDSGSLEIHRFVPPALLKHVELDDLSFEEFFHYLAMARWVQELEGLIVQNAVAKAFGAESQ